LGSGVSVAYLGCDGDPLRAELSPHNFSNRRRNASVLDPSELSKSVELSLVKQQIEGDPRIHNNACI